MPVSLTRTVTFHARHRYWVPAWPAAQNLERFGEAAAETPHGHAYQCSVSVTGSLDPTTTMLVDLPVLDRILAEEVLVLDGTVLNRSVPEFANGSQQPSCEALSVLLFDRIAARLPAGVSLVRVRLAEDTSLHADCTEVP